jgi:hypothetical protein
LMLILQTGRCISTQTIGALLGYLTQDTA